jgi:hypothetical protein
LLWSFSFAAPEVALNYYERHGHCEKEYQHASRVRERSFEHPPFSLQLWLLILSLKGEFQKLKCPRMETYCLTGYMSDATQRFITVSALSIFQPERAKGEGFHYMFLEGCTSFRSVYPLPYLKRQFSTWFWLRKTRIQTYPSIESATNC